MKNKMFKMSLMLLFSIFSIVKSEIVRTIHSVDDIYKDTETGNYTDKKGYILPVFQYGYNQDVTNWVDSAKHDISFPFYNDNYFLDRTDKLEILNINNKNNESLGNPFETRYNLNNLVNNWTFNPKVYINSDNFEKNKEVIYKNFREPFYKKIETKDKYKKLMHKYLDKNKQLSINDMPEYEEFLNENEIDEFLLDRFNKFINFEKEYAFSDNNYNLSHRKKYLDNILKDLKSNKIN